MPNSPVAPSSPEAPQSLPRDPLLLRVALLAVVWTGAAFFFDAPVDAWFLAHRDPAWEVAAKAVSRYGAWHWLMGGAAIGLAVCLWRGRRNGVRILVMMMIAASVAGLGADCIRGLTGRTRPNAPAPQGWYGVHHDSKWLIGLHAYNSFPSGHTTAATAFATALWLVRRRAGTPLLLGAAVVALSRLYLRDHHFSDVVAGAFLGAGVAIWTRYSLMPHAKLGALRLEKPSAR